MWEVKKWFSYLVEVPTPAMSCFRHCQYSQTMCLCVIFESSWWRACAGGSTCGAGPKSSKVWCTLSTYRCRTCVCAARRDPSSSQSSTFASSAPRDSLARGNPISQLVFYYWENIWSEASKPKQHWRWLLRYPTSKALFSSFTSFRIHCYL